MTDKPSDELIYHVGRSMAIELLENTIAEQKQRIQELLIHNTELLGRARRAEQWPGPKSAGGEISKN